MIIAMRIFYPFLFLFFIFPFNSIWSQCSGATTEVPCDDANPCTENDFEIILVSDGSVCVPCNGTVIDCSLGTTTELPCDDGNPLTINDMQTLLDCDWSVCVPCGGISIGCTTNSTTVQPCDDGDNCTINDVETILDADGSICVPCQGTPTDCSNGTTSVVSCDDGDPTTVNDLQTILDCDETICIPCSGVPCDPTISATSTEACDDGDDCTINDLEVIINSNGEICVPCEGTPVDCTNGTTSVVPCDDGDPTTMNDVKTILDCDGSTCVPCQGTLTSTPIFTGLFAPSNWSTSLTNTNGSVFNNGSSIIINGDTDGMGSNLDEIDCTAVDGNVSYCINVPSSGDITFDWAGPSGTSFNPEVEKLGYCLDGLVTELTSSNPFPSGTSSGTKTITVIEGNELCFVAASKFSDGLNSGTYTLNNFTLPGELAMDITASSDELACFGDTNGSIVVMPTGGAGGYTYTWDDVTVSGNNPMNLGAGTYCVTLTDAAGTTTETCATITEPEALSITMSSTNELDMNADGTATATIGGGTPEYYYQWSTAPPQTTETAIGLSIGTYTVTVTDANNCEIIENVTVDQITALEDFSAVTKFQIFPNPSNGKINLEMDFERKLDIKIQLFNSIGQQISTMQLQNIKSVRQAFEWGALPKGLYWLSIASEDEQLLQKIILV